MPVKTALPLAAALLLTGASAATARSAQEACDIIEATRARADQELLSCGRGTCPDADSQIGPCQDGQSKLTFTVSTGGGERCVERCMMLTGMSDMKDDKDDGDDSDMMMAPGGEEDNDAAPESASATASSDDGATMASGSASGAEADANASVQTDGDDADGTATASATVDADGDADAPAEDAEAEMMGSDGEMATPAMMDDGDMAPGMADEPADKDLASAPMAMGEEAMGMMAEEGDAPAATDDDDDDEAMMMGGDEDSMPAVDTVADAPAPAQAECESVLDGLLALPEAATLLTLAQKFLDAATLSALTAPANLTIFVPPADDLLRVVGGVQEGDLTAADVASVLRLHVVPEALMATELLEMDGDMLPTLAGEDDMLTIMLDGDTLMLGANNTVAVTEADLEVCADGLTVHLIDGILLPEGTDLDVAALPMGDLDALEAAAPTPAPPADTELPLAPEDAVDPDSGAFGAASGALAATVAFVALLAF